METKDDIAIIEKMIAATKDPTTKLGRANFLLRRRKTVIEDLYLKQQEEDWHGVQDAASDLRDIDSEIKGLKF